MTTARGNTPSACFDMPQVLPQAQPSQPQEYFLHTDTMSSMDIVIALPTTVWLKTMVANLPYQHDVSRRPSHATLSRAVLGAQPEFSVFGNSVNAQWRAKCYSILMAGLRPIAYGMSHYNFAVIHTLLDEV